MFDWNDLRFFLELQRSGCLLTAAKRLGTTHAMVARHIENIERDLGTQLFVQHTGGYQLASAGQALLEHAEAVENATLLAQEEMSQSISPLGQIHVGITEGLGSVFPASRLAQLIRHYPGPEVGLVSVPRFVSTTNREAGITISLDRPSADLVITRLLTRYRLALFASPAYLEQAPPLRDRDGLNRYQQIGYVDDLLFSQELIFHHSFCRHPQVVFRSTSAVTRQQAAQTGVGLAILLHFMDNRDPLLVPVLPEESTQREHWMSTRWELHRSVRLRVIWDFLLELCQREREVLLGLSATPPS